jgi:cytosine/adenosine deaminase-related metal-dependent hydrolase
VTNSRYQFNFNIMECKVLKDGTVLTFDDATKAVKVLRRASILIRGDRIADIVENGDNLSIPDGAEVIDMLGRIVSPGFVNTHVHMWQSVYRTMGPNVVLARYFGWVSQFSETATAAFTPDDVYISSLQGYLEGLNAGITSYVEHAHNNWSRDVVKPGYDAAVDGGARVWWCYDIAHRDNFAAEEQWQALEQLVPDAEAPVQLGLSLDGLAWPFLNDSSGGELERAKQMMRRVHSF